MKKTIVLMVVILAATHSFAQKFYTKNGLISFYSKSSMEDITADNNEVLSVINTTTGDLQFSVLNTGFHFKKALMEEHFNENYMESDKYPKAIFKGKITNLSAVNFAKDGSYTVTVTGPLTMHGVTNTVTADGTVTIKNGSISATSKFKIKLADYEISIPSVVKNNIAEIVDVTVSCNYPNKM